MGLAYPIAKDAETALKADDTCQFAGTQAEAARFADGQVALVTEWFKPESEEVEASLDHVDRHMGRGFVQSYANKDGDTVLAISYWKPITHEEAQAVQDEADRKQAEDAVEHTTDLYFTKPEERRKRFRRNPRKVKTDPNQLDFFKGPDQKGNESPDPANPDIIIVESEGDGTTFGA